MQTEIIVKPLTPKQALYFICEYQDPKSKKWFYINQTGTECIEGKSTAENKAFRIQAPAGADFTFPLNTESSSYLGIVNFFKNCPYAQITGQENKNLVMPRIEVTIMLELAKSDLMAIKEKATVISKILSATFEDLRDLAFAIGTNPAGLTHAGLISRLIGTTFEGDAMLKKVKAENGLEVLAVNYIRDKKADERRMIVMVQKAIHLGVIITEDNTYKCAGTVLGDTIPKVVAALKGNPDVYDNVVVPGVESADHIDPELLDTEFVKLAEHGMEKETKNNKSKVPV